MATTEVFYNGDNSDVTFTIPFEYLEESDVKVSVGGTLKTQDTDYTFSTLTEITFTTAPPTGVNNVRIFRDTDINSLRNEFFAGSAIRAQDLNDNYLQTLYSAQELEDQFVTKSDGEFDTNIDMNDNRITELADPVNAQDAVTKQYLEDNYFDDGTETITSGETWTSNDTTIATTQSIDNRVNSKIDTAIEGDILINNTGLSKSATGGQVTLGIAANSVDLDRIKDSDKITLSEQESDNDQVGTDDQIFTAQAATRRFNNYYQNDAPTDTDGVGIGQVWVDPNDDLTLSVWNGSSWTAITSGGTFTNQPKVVYVDAESGDDSNDGHRISRPKKTIAAALSDINGDSEGDGSIISVAPGIYAETLPLDIEKNDIGIIGQSLRTCIIHPKIPTADQASYDVDTPHSQELQTMFRVNSGSYFANLTLTGLKASGSRGTGASLYTNTTYGLPPNQGWNFAFYPSANIKKSPYIQNVTNFSDSQINNVTFTPHTPGEGAAGDLDSAPTGGGILVDGSVPATASPLRSMVCDSYTHTALDGPGIFVTNNGYCQATSSYAFFNHAHITAVNGGQANLAASTSDFGRYGLIADGKSTSAIFTSNVDGAASSGATSFNVNEPTAGSGWFGDTERPATNMLVEVNSVIYPILSATANTDSEGGNGWTVTISRPDPNNRSTNLGLNGAISDDAAVSFYLRSMIASSSHTMEYVGSGTDYRALPENGGVPVEANQKIELNNGKIWTATTDHNGKFTIGGNQTDDPFFEVDQQLGFVTIPAGSIAFNLLSDLTPQLGGDLDVNGNTITGLPTTPTSSSEATSKAYVDAQIAGIDEVVEDTTPQLGGNLDVNGNEITSASNGDVTINPNGTGNIVLDANVGIGTAAPSRELHVANSSGDADLRIESTNTGGDARLELIADNTGVSQIRLGDQDTANVGHITYDHDDNNLNFKTNGSERLRIDSSGNVIIGTGSASSNVRLRIKAENSYKSVLQFADQDDDNVGELAYNHVDNSLAINVNDSERLRIDSSGRLLVGTSSARTNYENSNTYGPILNLEGTSNSNRVLSFIHNDNSGGPFLALGSTGGSAAGSNTLVAAQSTLGFLSFQGADGTDLVAAARIKAQVDGTPSANDMPGRLIFETTADGASSPIERMRIQSNGFVKAINGRFFVQNSDSGTGDTDGLALMVDGNRDTYVWNYENTSLRFATNNTERMRIDSSGRVGLGTTATQQALTIDVNDSGTTQASFNGINIANTDTTANNGSAITFGQTVAGNSNARIGVIQTARGPSESQEMFFGLLGSGSYSERMRIDSSGNVGIGTTSIASGGANTTNFNVHTPSATSVYLKLSNSSTGNTASDAFDLSADSSGNAYLINRENGNMTFWTNATERMRINANGRLLFGQSTTDAPGFGNTATGISMLPDGRIFSSMGSTFSQFNRNSDGGVLNFARSSTGVGVISVTTTSTSYGTSSDYRLKENVVALDGAIARVKQLLPKRFNFIVDADTTVDGFLAHEAQTVVPEAVTGTHDEVDDDSNPVYQCIDQSKLVPLLTAALQEAIAKIETLETKVAALEAG